MSREIVFDSAKKKRKSNKTVRETLMISHIMSIINANKLGDYVDIAYDIPDNVANKFKKKGYKFSRCICGFKEYTRISW